MGIITLIIIILIVVITLLCLPISYTCRLYIGSPFHISGTLCWLGRMISYTWQYTSGYRPQTDWHILGKTYQSSEMPLHDEGLTKKQQEKIVHELTKEHAVTYDELRTANHGGEPVEKKHNSFPWKSLICTREFAFAFFTWLQKLLYLSRIRTLTLTGSMGLTAPHKTGMLAGALYAVIPSSIAALHFNFTSEEYDCTIHASGHICLVAVLSSSITFLLSRPVRHLLTQWHIARKEENHG